MKINAIKYNKTKMGQSYVYQFLMADINKSYLFENFGTMGDNGLISYETPNEMLEWFRDIQGEDDSILAFRWLKRATKTINRCNNGAGCSSKCDLSKRQKCSLLSLQAEQQRAYELTWKFIDYALTEGFVHYTSHADFKNRSKKE